MTAILEPGDHIHLALPMSTHLTEAARDAEGKRQADALTQVCSQHDVTVVSWSSHSALSHPVASLVFRDRRGTP